MRILLTLVIALLIFSCSTSSSSEKSILISGQTEKKQGDYFYLVKSEEGQGWGGFYKALDSVLVDSLGAVFFELETEEAGFYQLRDADRRNFQYQTDLFLKPGDTLNFNMLNGEIVFSGNAGLIHQVQQVISDSLYKGDNYRKKNYLEPEAFNKLLEKNKKTFDLIIDQNELPIEYAQYLNHKIKARTATDYYNYLKYHSIYAHGIWNHLSFDSLPSKYNTNWSASHDFYWVEDYANSIIGSVNAEYENRSKDLLDSIKYHREFEDKFEFIKAELTEKNRDMALAELSKDFWLYLSLLQDSFYVQAEEVANYFELNKSSDLYFDLFNSNYIGFNNIKPGMPAPDFTLVDRDGKEVSLSEYKDKIVYLDLWGTWCGPCLEAIPKHIALQEKFKEEEGLVFINVALEGDEEDIARWKKFMSEKDWPGIHLVAEKQFYNPELMPYKVRATPTYILINQGKMVSPRASSPDKIAEQITALLKNK